MHSWYSPRCTHGNPPDALMISPRCTEHPPMYWTSPECTEHPLYRLFMGPCLHGNVLESADRKKLSHLWRLIMIVTSFWCSYLWNECYQDKIILSWCYIIYWTNAAQIGAACWNISQVVKLKMHQLQHPLVFQSWYNATWQLPGDFVTSMTQINSQSDLISMPSFAILPHNQILCLHDFSLRSLYFQSLQSLPDWIQLIPRKPHQCALRFNE